METNERLKALRMKYGLNRFYYADRRGLEWTAFRTMLYSCRFSVAMMESDTLRWTGRKKR